MNFSVIPNYASQGISNLDFQRKIDNICDLKKSKIIFARRFTRYRGAQLFANVVKRLLLKYPELDFTFAGDGELEGILKKEFEHSPNVHFTKYSADQSIDFHKDYDIAVVPTIYSEGTSLSLCEAMAAGCLPIATHVGGITNLIIDSFNGMLCYPNENHLLETIEKVINKDVNSYKDLLKNAYQTYVKALNKEKWEERWIAYINTLGE
jgi:glycosyltransferase involved in cell wall biosynthesis